MFSCSGYKTTAPEDSFAFVDTVLFGHGHIFAQPFQTPAQHWATSNPQRLLAGIMEEIKHSAVPQCYFMSPTLYTKLEKKSATDLVALPNNFKLLAETNIRMPELS